ncbi:hypothetical protein BDQ94DRAFT_154999 [Aspergillus welwitschiae]|uniref:Uncharacterized protein n=1 Tax=Aspergillus welwitschiae TaxID=1341132 RepID=A0A3F3PJ55_9EURO|nr:hypothetical protein BDQ94DRAFT_154999 [Aspergillus welwitschiae]RDH26772.1 hypothetical protein BDQ94DRAFT_154999 [Aspergillus welwitschiae]
MHLPLATLTPTLLAAVTAVTAATLPGKFTLASQNGDLVRTDGQNIFLGARESGHPKLVLSSSSGGEVTYTAKEQTPTGGQYLFVVSNDVEPVGLTSPHSGQLPEDGQISNFSVRDDGVFVHGGKPWFAVDPDVMGSRKIFWLGLGHSKYQQVLLSVNECEDC